MRPLDLSHSDNYWELQTTIGLYRLYTSGAFIHKEGEKETRLDELNWVGVLKDFKHYQVTQEEFFGPHIYVWVSEKVFRYSVGHNKWCAWDSLVDPWDIRSRMKILLVALGFLLVGCSGISEEDIKVCREICKETSISNIDKRLGIMTCSCNYRKPE